MKRYLFKFHDNLQLGNAIPPKLTWNIESTTSTRRNRWTFLPTSQKLSAIARFPKHAAFLVQRTFLFSISFVSPRCHHRNSTIFCSCFYINYCKVLKDIIQPSQFVCNLILMFDIKYKKYNQRVTFCCSCSFFLCCCCSSCCFFFLKRN